MRWGSPVRLRSATLGGPVISNGSQVVYDAGRKNRLLAVLKDMLGLSTGHSTLPDEYSCSREPIFFRQLKTAFITGSVKVVLTYRSEE